MPSLTVHFRGICVHFRNVLNDIAHRVVLPNATPLRFGLVDVPKARHTLAYALAPHVAVLSVSGDDDQKNLNVPGMSRGLITQCIRFEVANARHDHVTYADCFDYDVLHIGSFVDEDKFSHDVVRAGRASCYFDVRAGLVEPDPPPPCPAGPESGSPILAGVKITIETTCRPILLATLVQEPDQPPVTTEVPLPAGDDVTLVVGNVGPGCGEDGSDGFDFLLNFLVLDGGIPRHLIKALPKPAQKPFDESLYRAVWQLCRHVHAPDKIDHPTFEQMFLNETLSCSNTQYP